MSLVATRRLIWCLVMCKLNVVFGCLRQKTLAAVSMVLAASVWLRFESPSSCCLLLQRAYMSLQRDCCSIAARLFLAAARAHYLVTFRCIIQLLGHCIGMIMSAH